MEYKDYYKILGVDKKASEKEIKKAYRKLARQCHPDVNPGDDSAEQRFKEINEANEVLSDPDKRKKYDQLGASWRQYQGAGGQPGGFDWSQWTTQPGGGRVHVEYADLSDLFGGGGGFSDFFSAIFGGAGRGGGSTTWRTQGQPYTVPGQDYEHEVEVTLEEAHSGTTRVMQKEGRRLEIKIPAGVQTGSRVRMRGEGGGSQGGGKGDLYLRVKVLPHPTMERRGDDLYCDVPVDLYTAVLGGEVRVPTLKGGAMLKIPPETQGGKTFRLKGQGMPQLKDAQQHGDLYARVSIQVPKKLNDKEKQLFKQLAEMR